MGRGVSQRFFLIAGEASGDRLGAALISGLRSLNPNASFFGVGGPMMEAQGLQSIFPMEELSVMGLAEVLPRLRSLFKRRDQAVEAALAIKPDALITIDSPDFCLRVARKLRRADPSIPTIHYVAPSVWAWRPKRAEKMARHIDHVLALLPFEPPYMQVAGMSCDFVGHPVVAEPLASAEDAAQFRAAEGIAPNAPLVLVLPGSRRSEVGRLADRFGQTLALLSERIPDLHVVLPAAEHVAGLVNEKAALWDVPVTILDPRETSAEDFAARKRAAFGAANVALAASGTVSLELAAANTPMVVAYDMNWLSRQIIGSMLQVDTVTLVNLVSDTRAVPEYLGELCRPDMIAAALTEILSNETVRLEQLNAAEVTMQRLGLGGPAPGLRAAQSVLAAIQAKKDGVK